MIRRMEQAVAAWNAAHPDDRYLLKWEGRAVEPGELADLPGPLGAAAAVFEALPPFVLYAQTPSGPSPLVF